MYMFRRVNLKTCLLLFSNNRSKNSIALSTTNMPYYAVAKGRTRGIFMSWSDCEEQVKGFPGARYKKFDTVDMAKDFIESVGGSRFSQTANNQGHKYSNSKNNLKRSYSTSSNNNEQESSRPQSSDSNSRELRQRNGTILIEIPEPKRQRTNETGFEEDDDGFIQVYTDGACSSNGKLGARAGFGVYWGDNHPLNTSEPVSGRATNNCGEIQAASHAMRQALQNGVTKLAINTDSKFLINSVTKWMQAWKQKGWKLKSGEPVKNEVDFKELDSLQHKLKIKWNYVEAHCGISGNEMADQLAKAGAAKYNK